MWSDDAADLIADLLPALAAVCLQAALLNTPFLRRGLRRMRRDALWVGSGALHLTQWGAAAAQALSRAAGGRIAAAAKGAGQRAQRIARHAKRAAMRSGAACTRSPTARTRPKFPFPMSRLFIATAAPKAAAPTTAAPKNTSPKSSSPKNSSPNYSGPNNGSPKNTGPANGSPPRSGPAASAHCSTAGSPAKNIPSPAAATVLLPLLRPRLPSPLQRLPTASPPRPRPASPTSFGAGDDCGTPPRDRPAASSSPPRVERFVYTQANSPERQPSPCPANMSPIRDGMSTPKAAGQPRIDPADRIVPGTPWISQETIAQHSSYRMGGVQPLALQ
eukprot:TRINITY_DN17880_c0_g2_i6.p1 TRINITY_DN17880_c0_g2~~TRINITY_DN17880_c0_g2_i6.p1  ORF type:complete len:365 (+),score=89.44 TRINITY_DN17880_c0_g2_i6:102-1097(+)